MGQKRQKQGKDQSGPGDAQPGGGLYDNSNRSGRQHREKSTGKRDTEALRTRPADKRLCMLSAPALELPELHDRVMWGGEPLLIDGEYTGEHVTSAALVPTRDPDGVARRLVNTGLAYLDEPGGSVWVEVAGSWVEMTTRPV